MSKLTQVQASVISRMKGGDTLYRSEWRNPHSYWFYNTEGPTTTVKLTTARVLMNLGMMERGEYDGCLRWKMRLKSEAVPEANLAGGQ